MTTEQLIIRQRERIAALKLHLRAVISTCDLAGVSCKVLPNRDVTERDEVRAARRAMDDLDE